MTIVGMSVRTDILDVLQESRVEDHWNVDLDRNLSDLWTGFTIPNGKRSKRIHMVGEGGLQRFKQLSDLIVCGMTFGPERTSSTWLLKNQSSTMLGN